MIATGKMDDGKWSERKVDVKEDLRTIECLRGRLLAERQASKIANEDAEQMGNKLIELENNLKEETKLRNKAEKKLRFLKKKIESLNILIPLDQSEQSSSSSDFCAHSCKSSTSTSGPKDSEESESKPQITTPQVSQNLDNNLSDTISSNQSHESASFQESSSCLDTANSSEHSSPRCEDSKPDDNHSMKAETEGDQNESESDQENVDNSLALVPVSNPVQAEKSESIQVKKITSRSVRDALDALRLARERIQCSMERRRMIRVGHS